MGMFLAVGVFALTMRAVGARRLAPFRIYVNSWGRGDYPVVQGYMTADEKSASALEVGDRILRVGDADQRGHGQVRLLLSVADVSWKTPGPLPFTVERNGTTMVVQESRPPSKPQSFYIRMIPSVVWGVAALLILLRAPPTTETRIMALGLASVALSSIAIFDGPAWAYAISLILLVIDWSLVPPLMLRVYLTFPAEVSLLRGWNRAWPWLFAGVGIPFLSQTLAFPFSPEVGRATAALPALAFIAVQVIIITLNYRHSSPVGRRRFRWILLAVYLGTALWVTAFGLTGSYGSSPHIVNPLWADVVFAVAEAAYPVGLLIAVLRFDLFDIDRIIGATVAYNALALVLVGASMILLPSLSDLLVSRLDIPVTVGRSGIAFAMAGMLLVTQKRVRPYVDRLFFKERFALAQAMNRLPEQLAAVRTAEQLWELTGSELVKNLRPASCVLFASSGSAFVPVFTDSESVPAAVPAGTALTAFIATLDAAVEVDRRVQQQVGDTGQAILRNLGARLIIPIHRRGVLEAFVVLGEKRSGDIYTHTDLTLLTTLAKSHSIHLLRFDEAELLERTQAIQEKMRRYVPGVLAEEIASGREVETGERDVSVLFVDIRGYTAFSAGRDATSTFSTINRYTETVSTIVRHEGGVVVEFNGDGMMAVFGAPRPLDNKERAAVRAARRLVEEVPRIERELGADEPLSVGVGVATGTAFVGNIEAVDRTIWSAIGSTTNLAARLQSMTRELDASVIVDSVTRQRAGDAADMFVARPGVAIRGRADAITVYSLRLGAAPA